MHCELRLSEDGKDVCVRDASMNGVGVVGPGGGRPSPVAKGSFDPVPQGGALLVPLKLNSKHGERVLLRVAWDSSRTGTVTASVPRKRRGDTEASEALEAEGGAYSDRDAGGNVRGSESPSRGAHQVTRGGARGRASSSPRSNGSVRAVSRSPQRAQSPSRVNVSGLWEMTSDKGRSFEYLWQHLTPRTFSGKQVGGSAVTGALSNDGTITWETGAVACKAVLLSCGKRIEDGCFWRQKSGEMLGSFTGVLRKAGHIKPEERSAEENPISRSSPEPVRATTASQPPVQKAPSEDGSGKFRGRRKERKERKGHKSKRRRRERSGSVPPLSPRAGSSPRPGSQRSPSPRAGRRAPSPRNASPRAGGGRLRSASWRRRREHSASLRQGRAQPSSLSRARSLGNGQRDGKRRRRR